MYICTSIECFYLMKRAEFTLISISLMLAILMGCFSCAPNSENEVITQAKPTIMVIPSDNLLKKHGAIKRDSADGVEFLVRDYEQYLLKDERVTTAIAIIQRAFIDANYPLNDLDKSLKQIHNRSLADDADGVAKDAKTLLLETVQPDIIIELDYSYDLSATSHDYNRALSYTITTIDAYTNKVFASSTCSDVKDKDFASAFTKGFKKRSGDIMKDINNYFGDIIENGREITVQFSVNQGASVNLSTAMSSTGMTYAEWIQDYMDYATINGTYKLERNTDVEMYFVNVRIPTQNSNGTQLNAMGWARQCVKEMRDKLKVNCTSHSQGLAHASIMIN